MIRSSTFTLENDMQSLEWEKHLWRNKLLFTLMRWTISDNLRSTSILTMRLSWWDRSTLISLKFKTMIKCSLTKNRLKKKIVKIIWEKLIRLKMRNELVRYFKSNQWGLMKMSLFLKSYLGILLIDVLYFLSEKYVQSWVK